MSNEKGDVLPDSESAQVAARRAKAGVAAGPTWALAFSGGGIRSATFCLGLARALAHNKLLHRFDYLSTVSGGGYIGSAIGRLYSKSSDAGAVSAGLDNDNSLFFWWLRRNGRFLLPAGAKDGLRAGASYLRGFAATQFEVAIMSLLLSCIIIAPHLLITFLDAQQVLGQTFVSAWWSLLPIPVVLAAVSTLAYWFTRDRGEVRAQWVDAGVATGSLVGAGALLSLACQTDGVMTGLRPMLFTAGAVLAIVFLGWLFKWATLRVPRDARVAWTSRLSASIVLFALVALAGALDLLSWVLASKINDLSHTVLAGGAGAMLLLTIVRAAMPTIQNLSKAHGIASAPERIASLAGLGLSITVLGFWLLLTQWFIYFGPGTSVVPVRWEWAAQWIGPFADFSAASGRWTLLFVIVVGYMLLSGHNAEQLNRASLYQLYRSRLARAYVSVGNSPDHETGKTRFPQSPLGDATTDAVQHLRKITEFVEHDDVRLGDYRPQDAGGPIHLVSCCINLSVDDRTGAYNADRKGMALTVSSLGYEFGTDWAEPAAADDRSELSQWVAISGSAFGSGMGSATRSGIAALSFLTGLRIGFWWNQDAATRPFAKYMAMLHEWFGSFPGRQSRNLYLSDGGHFDNTGIYALLKRRPKLIVLADCGADPDYVFADVESLVRKARIDYRADIDILDPETFPSNDHVDAIKERFGTADSITPKPGGQHLLLARIQYAPKHGSAVRETGTLLIVKPRRIEALPLDIAGYSDRDTNYPQQTTADQFFDEAQWESYCQLGKSLGLPLTADVLEALPEVAAGAKIATTKNVAVKPDPKTQETTGSRRERLAVNVGKTVSIGAALSVLAGGWQVWQDTRASLQQSESDELALVKGVLSGATTNDDLLKRMRAATDPQDVLDGVISSLEQLGALHGEDAMERARAKVASGLYRQCALSLEDGGAAVASNCALALSVLSTRALKPWSVDIDNYWDRTAVRRGDDIAPTCAREEWGGRSYLLVYEGAAPDEQAKQRVATAAKNLGLRYISDTRQGFGIAEERDTNSIPVQRPALLASVADENCGTLLLGQLDTISSFRNPQPMFSYATGMLQYWLPQQAVQGEKSGVPVAAAPPPPPPLPEASAPQAGAPAPDISIPAVTAPAAIAKPTVATAATQIESNAVKPNKGVAALARPLTIFVQFQGSTTRAQINDYRQYLSAATSVIAPDQLVSVPGAERRPEQFDPEVRYFHGEDQTAAAKVVELTNQYYKALGCKDLDKVKLTLSGQRAPAGQIEVWVKPSCS